MSANVAVLDGGRGAARSPKKEKTRFSISLSSSAAEAFEELRDWTDVDTDSEVFRNALRIHKMLIRAHRSGKKFLIEDTDTGETERVRLFVQED